MNRRRTFVAGGAALLVALVAGGAIAATKALTPRQESQAVINDAARELGVEPDELSNALKQALKNRVDAAVEDGRLTKEQGARMKERIDAGRAPLFGLGPGPGFRHHRGHHGPGGGPLLGRFEAAADYLGLNRRQLHEALRSGKTLAQLARDRDKSVDGLIAAMLDEAEQKLDEAVESGKLTEGEKADMLEGMRKRITDLVNGRIPVHRGKDGGYFRPSVF
jgi:polyhydroxyalkanoate synthesis regulator phasin